MPVILGIDGLWWLLGGMGLVAANSFGSSAGSAVGSTLTTPLLIGGVLIAIGVASK